MSLLKINILRHLVCDVTFSPGDGEETPGKGLKTVHVHDTATSGVGCYNDVISGREFTAMTSLPVCDVTSCREKRLKPTRI